MDLGLFLMPLHRPERPHAETYDEDLELMEPQAGEVLVTWSENTGWKKASRLAFEVLAKDGQRIPTHSGQQSVPVWSLTAAYALPDGSFEILH